MWNVNCELLNNSYHQIVEFFEDFFYRSMMFGSFVQLKLVEFYLFLGMFGGRLFVISTCVALSNIHYIPES